MEMVTSKKTQAARQELWGTDNKDRENEWLNGWEGVRDMENIYLQHLSGMIQLMPVTMTDMKNQATGGSSREVKGSIRT